MQKNRAGSIIQYNQRLLFRACSSAAERPAHNRLVAGSNPAGPRIDHFLTGQFTIKKMLEILLGTEGKGKLRLRDKTSNELFEL